MMWTYPDTRYYYDWYEGLPPSATHPSDGTIKAAVVDRLRVNPLTRDDDLRVDVKRGVVILQGIVGSRLAKRAAGDDCWDTPGVTDLSNQLEVADAVEHAAGEEPISTIMSTDVVALETSAPLRTAAEVMRDADVGSVVVTDGGHVAGIVTDRDVVIRAAAEGRDLAATSLGSISSNPVVSVDREVPIADVVRLMRGQAVRRVVVTASGDRPVGVVSLGDLARRRDPGSVLADITGAPSDAA